MFVFFGLVATVGSTYVQLGAAHRAWSLVAGAGVGLLAVALLVVNNLRDIPTDRVAGKRTLAVRLGDRRTRSFYIGLVAAAFVAAVACAAWWRSPAALALVSLPLAVGPVRRIHGGASGRQLIAVLGATGRLQLGFGASFAVGLALGG